MLYINAVPNSIEDFFITRHAMTRNYFTLEGFAIYQIDGLEAIRGGGCEGENMKNEDDSGDVVHGGGKNAESSSSTGGGTVPPEIED